MGGQIAAQGERSSAWLKRLLHGRGRPHLGPLPLGRSNQHQIGILKLGCVVGDSEHHIEALERGVGIDLHPIDADFGQGTQLHLAQDAVPLDLRGIGVGMAEFIDRDVVLLAVIDTNLDGVPACCKPSWQGVAMGRHEALVGVVECLDWLTIDEDGALPKHTFEDELQRLVGHLLLHFERTGVIGLTHETVTARETQDLRLRETWLQRVGRADACHVGGSGQLDGLRRCVGTIEAHLPLSTQIDDKVFRTGAGDEEGGDEEEQRKGWEFLEHNFRKISEDFGGFRRTRSTRNTRIIRSTPKLRFSDY